MQKMGVTDFVSEIKRMENYSDFEKLAHVIQRNSACFTGVYYMALSHKDWELPNSRIWLAEMDIDRGLDFPI